MPSGQEYAHRLREEAYRTLSLQVKGLEQEIDSLNSSLSTSISQISRKLDALRHIDLPTTDVVLTEVLEEVTRKKDLDTSSLASFARYVQRKETQEEILTLLLDFAQRFSPRVVLLVVRGGQFVGWSSRGFAEETARRISLCSFPRSDSARLREALEGEGMTTAVDISPESDHLQFLQEEGQGPWHLFPMKALQRPAALLLAAGDGDSPCNLDALSILMDTAVLCIENMALKILYELMAARPQAPIPQPALSAVLPEVAARVERPAPIAAPAMMEQGTAIETPPPVPISIPGTELAGRVEPEPVPPSTEPAQAAAERPATSVAARMDLEAEPAGESVPAGEAVPDEAVSGQPAEHVSTEAEAAAPSAEADTIKVAQQKEVKPIAEEEKLHADARRFARLLVSEIKLYNEQHVIEGRENRDLYLRLKRDIDRSRESYERRVSPSVSRRVDYFHDEVIRILGNNDPSTLGSDYPGPRVES